MNKETNDFIEELKENDNVLGIILFGSWARGNNRSDSDMDLVVIQKEGYQRAIEKRGGQIFEIIYTTEKSAFDFWDSHKDDCAGLWEVAKILFDRDGSIELLKEKVQKEIIEKGKKEINDKQLEQFRFDAEDQLNYVERIQNEDSTTARLILNNKLFSLTELFFDIHQLWTPAPKQRLQKMKEIDSKLSKLLEDFYSEKNDFQTKLEIARKIVNKVFEK